MIHAKAAKLTEMPFGLWTGGGTKEPCFRWGPGSPREGALWGSYLGMSDLPRSIFSTLFARGSSDAVSAWLPVNCIATCYTVIIPVLRKRSRDRKIHGYKMLQETVGKRQHALSAFY